MKSEIEVKFLAVNVDEIHDRLKSAGAVCKTPMRLLRRYVVETPEMHKHNAFIRVRDEGDKVSMTYKQFDDLSVDGAKEIEVELNNFENGMDIINILCPVTNRASYQESRRETWKLDSAEIVIDQWPWIKPYIEIEADSEPALRSVAQKIGLDWSNAVFGDVMVAYRAEYHHLTLKDTVGSIDKITFEDPLPQLFNK